VAYFLGTNTL